MHFYVRLVPLAAAVVALQGTVKGVGVAKRGAKAGTDDKATANRLPSGTRPWAPTPHSAPSPTARPGGGSVGQHQGPLPQGAPLPRAACAKTFAASKGTPLYRLHKGHALFVCVLTLLARGCPLQAVVAAFGLDERTVADWPRKAGAHRQGVHDRPLNTKKLDLQHAQADELYVRCVGGRCWMAVPYRLELGGVVSPIRNLNLI
jgi:hypothetical protein